MVNIKRVDRVRVRPAGSWICLAVYVWFGGCASVPTHDERTVRRENTDYDATRALLTLRQIQPDPPAPAPSETPPPELSAPSLRRLGRAMERYRQRRYTEATLELEKALRRDPEHPRVHRALAKTLYAMGSVERVRAHLRKALAGDGDDITLHYLQGRLAYDDGRNDDAIREYRVALKCSNAAAEGAYVAATRFHLARVLNAEGYLTAAIESYRAYARSVAALPADARDEPAVASLIQINGGTAGGPISVAYEKLGRFDEAADALAASMRDREADADTRERLVHLLARSGRFEEALEQARKLLDDPGRAVELLIEVHEQAGHPEDVVADIERLHDAHPERSDLLMSYVDVLTRFNRAAEAEDALRTAADRRPGDVAVSWRLADLYRKKGRWDDAVKASAVALRTDNELHETARVKARALAANDDAVTQLLGRPDRLRVFDVDYAEAFVLGTIALEAGRTEQASSLFGRAVADRPEFVPARVELARILKKGYRWQEIIDLVSADKDQLRGDARLERLCGQAYAGLDDVENAESHLSAAIRLDRTDTEAVAALASVFRAQHEPRRAQRQYESLLAANPLDETSREALFELYLFALDRRSDAAVQLAELRRLAASPHRIARCQARLDLGRNPTDEDWDQYRARLSNAIEQSGPDVKTIEMIAQSHLAQNHPEKAFETLEGARGIDAEDTEFLVSRAQVYRRLLDYPRAITTMERLLDRHPNRVPWIDWRLERLIEDHRFSDAYDTATEQLERPGRADDDTKRYRVYAVDALQRAKRFDEEVALLQAWMAETPDDDLWPQLLVDAFKVAERYDDAIAAARARYAARPNAMARDDLWLAYMAAERYVSAQQFLLSELEEDPDDDRLMQLLVQTLMFADRDDDALELVHDRRYQPRPGIDWRGLEAAVLQHAKRHDEAIKIWTKRLREAEAEGPENPHVTEVRLRLSDALIQAMRLDDAATKIGRWILETGAPVARFRLLGQLSNCHQIRGDSKGALAAMQEQFDLIDAVRSSPPHTRRKNQLIIGLHNDFGYSLADAGRRIDEARRLIRYALFRNPRSAAYLDSYGWVLYKSGEYAEAERWLKKATGSPLGQDAVVYDHLGDTLWRLGRADQAAGTWNKSVALIDESLETLDRPDHRRLRKLIKAKLDAVASGGTPQVAPPAPAADAKTDDDQHEDTSAS